MNRQEQVDKIYRLAWENELGNENQYPFEIKAHLVDYAGLLAQTSQLYSHLTDDKISDPYEKIDVVLKETNAYTASVLDEGILHVLTSVLDHITQSAGQDSDERVESIADFVADMIEKGMEPKDGE